MIFLYIWRKSVIKRSSNLVFQAYISLLSFHLSFFLPVKSSPAFSLYDTLFLIPLIKIQLEHRVYIILPNRRAFTYPFSFALQQKQALNAQKATNPTDAEAPQVSFGQLLLRAGAPLLCHWDFILMEKCTRLFGAPQDEADGTETSGSLGDKLLHLQFLHEQECHW